VVTAWGPRRLGGQTGQFPELIGASVRTPVPYRQSVSSRTPVCASSHAAFTPAVIRVET